MRSNTVTARAVAPNVYEAFRRLVLGFGVERMAHLMGTKTGTLYNKADGSDDSHNQPTLRDVMLATQISGDMQVVEAFAETFGRATYDCQQHEGTSDEALLELVTALGREHGEFHAAMHEGLTARRFTMEQMRKVRAQAFDVVSALMVLVHRLEGYVDVEG